MSQDIFLAAKVSVEQCANNRDSKKDLLTGSPPTETIKQMFAVCAQVWGSDLSFVTYLTVCRTVSRVSYPEF